MQLQAYEKGEAENSQAITRDTGSKGKQLMGKGEAIGNKGVRLSLKGKQ